MSSSRADTFAFFLFFFGVILGILGNLVAGLWVELVPKENIQIWFNILVIFLFIYLGASILVFIIYKRRKRDVISDLRKELNYIQ